MAQLKYTPKSSYKRIEATIRKDFMDLRDPNYLGKNNEMEKMAGNRYTFSNGGEYSYNCLEMGWSWDIAWLEDIVVLEESSTDEEEDML